VKKYCQEGRTERKKERKKERRNGRGKHENKLAHKKTTRSSQRGCLAVCACVQTKDGQWAICVFDSPPSVFLCAQTAAKSMQALPNKQTERQTEQQRGFGNLSMCPSSSLLSDPYWGREQCDVTRCIHKYSSRPTTQCQGSLWKIEVEGGGAMWRWRGDVIGMSTPFTYIHACMGVWVQRKRQRGERSKLKREKILNELKNRIHFSSEYAIVEKSGNSGKCAHRHMT